MSKQISAKSSNFGVAVSLIALGVLFLLHNFDILEIGWLWRLWPVLLIVIGLSKLYSSDFQDRGSAFTLIAIGGVFFLLTFDIVDWDTIWQFWPVILIIIGGSIIYNRVGRRSAESTEHKRGAEDRVDMVALFGGHERKVASEQFEGGNVTAIFGGAKLDLMGSKLSDGENILDILSLFGGAEIFLPADWQVILKGVPIFGGFEDARVQPTGERATDKTLVIKGFVLFGGLSIKSA